MITDSHIEKNGRTINKISLLYIDSDDMLCDACDEMKKCASLHLLCSDTAIICKDCLLEIVNEFDDTTE